MSDFVKSLLKTDVIFRKYFINNRLIVDSFLKFFKKCTLIFLTIVKICFNIHQPIWFIRR